MSTQDLIHKYRDCHWAVFLREYFPFFLLIFPGVVITILFVFIPVLYSVLLSFFKLETILATPKFVGIENYKSILSDFMFWSALKNGIIYAVSSVSIQIIIGVAIALVLDKNFKFRSLIRGISVVPYVIPTVVVAFTWSWILDGNIGIVNKFLKELGFASVTWFETPFTAMFSIIMVSVWTWTPFVTLCFLAGLQSVPLELYEAARIDGANAVQRFFLITVPVLKPVIIVIILLRAVWMFNKFDIVWLLTEGGPLHSTEHLPALSYIKAFKMFDVGEGAAVATVNFLILIVFIIFYLKRVDVNE